MTQSNGNMQKKRAEWIGATPAHWKIARVKNEFICTKMIAGENSEKYNRLALTMNGIINRSKVDNVGLQPEKFETYQIVRENELVFKLIDLQNISTSRIGRAPCDGIVSPAYIILRNRNGDSTRYAEYFFKVMWMHQIFNQLGADGVRSNISVPMLLNLPFPIVPLTEQSAIADYLDTACSDIDTAIAMARASVDEYKLLKRSIITRAVTKGLDSNTETKDTRIPWIGAIPANWRVAPLKRFVSVKAGITLGKKYPPNAELVEVPYLRVANVQGEYIDLSDVSTILVEPEEIERYSLKAGELLMTEGGDRDKLGRGTIWNGEISPCLHQNHVFAVSSRGEELDLKYLDYLTTSEVGRLYFDVTAKKTTNLASTNMTTILRFPIPVPPIEEQREICAYLEQKIDGINNILAEKQAMITDLEAYKKSLIYEVVTGKRRVP